MTLARSLSVTHRFEHDGVVYTLRTLPNRVLLALPNMEDQQQVELVVRAGVADWSGLKGADGNDVPCEQSALAIGGIALDKGLTIGCFDTMPFQHLPVVAAEIVRVNNLSDEDVGNS